MRNHMKKQVKISVVMGVYNPQRERLRKAVGSIIGQTMKDWELILYDDGSDSPYIRVIRETAAMDERIVCVRNKKNHGLAYALNQCMKQTKGKYIARMDDDDISRPERFQKQYEFLETHAEYGWVGSNAELFDDERIWGDWSVPETPQTGDFLKYSPYIHPLVMFRREILEKNNGYIPAEVTRRCEDYELFMRLHIRGSRGYNLQENLIEYHESEDSYRKRLLKYRLNEMWIRYRGFRRMGILTPATVPFVVRPLAGGAVPAAFMKYISRHRRDIRTQGYGSNGK